MNHLFRRLLVLFALGLPAFAQFPVPPVYVFQDPSGPCSNQNLPHQWSLRTFRDFYCDGRTKLWTLTTSGSGASIWGSITGTLSDQTDVSSALAAKEALANKGVAGGYAGLDGSSKVAASTIPNNSANTTGQANTALALAALPTPCSAGNYPLGILANGNSTGCTPAAGGGTNPFAAGGGTPSTQGIYCSTGSVTLSGGTFTYPGGTVAAAAATSQEFVIITALTGAARYEHVFVSEHTAFTQGASVTLLKASIGRPGSTTNDELLAQFPLMQSSGDAWNSYDRPQPPILGSGNAYTLVLALRTTGGNISNLTAGQVNYEVCGYAN